MQALKKLIKFARDAWLIFGMAMLMLVAIEVILSAVFYLKDIWRPPDSDYRIKADTFAGAPWTPQYFEDLEGLGLPRWAPYVYWRRKPHEGNGVTIDSDGIRKTYNGAASKASDSAIKVFMFGGSTMWGAGARDDFTIPSYFAKEVESRGITCKVTNFGQTGYVSTQEVIDLLLQIQSGNIPDVVIFYDGVNDTFAAFQQDVAGLPQNEVNRETEFNLLQKKEIRSLAVRDAVKGLSTIRLINGISARLGGSRSGSAFRPLEWAKPVSDKQALARAVIETYINNVKLVQALSKFYGFKCLFYWQPVIYQKRQLTDYEHRAIELEHNYAGMKEFYEETYAVMQKRAEKSLERDLALRDISSIFDQVHEPIYIDYCHIGEKGNNMVAGVMVEDFMRLTK